jgi:hypothetical protein
MAPGTVSQRQHFFRQSENTDDSAHGTLCHKTRYLQRQTEEQK